ncbi:hypothetical protein C8Q74DRAFT_706933 [Fomes fomentarius]|nr:hypothetical protein C8Q74DRAFT_706933 [Fomes fomentarius]
MASYYYKDSPNANLVCCICRSPFVDPCTTRTCCHTFCYECIAQAISVNGQCPIDRAPLALHDLMPADPVIRNLVDELIVSCPQEPLGCTHTCQRLLLSVHLSDSCQYMEVGCTNARCGQRVMRKDVKDHRCSDVTGESKEQRQSASAVDPQEKETPPIVASSAPAASTRPTVDLAAENTMLRLRLSALESVVHALRAEMFAVKHALGPWYRPEVQPELLPEERSEDMQDSSEAFERQLAEELAAQPAVSGSDISSSPTSRDPTDIASYFPPAEGPLHAAPARQSRHRSTSGVLPIYPPHSSGQAHPYGPISPASNTYQAGFTNSAPNVLYGTAAFQTPGQTSGMSYSQGTSFGAASHAAISIPPLDPMKPLPDTLATLHSSLATLAGALGTLAATRSAESLRTAEELRGLRAAMHGLRMQVRPCPSTYVPVFPLCSKSCLAT